MAPRKAAGAAEPVRADAMLLERIHSRLYTLVGEAVDDVVDLETTWSATEMTRRIVKYIYKSASDVECFKQGSWNKCVDSFISKAMNGYSAACQERAWFFEIELVPAFTAATWELLRFHRMEPRYEKLEECVKVNYEDRLDRILNSKAMWDATRNTFPKDDQAVSKVFNALYKSFDTALDEAVSDTRPVSNQSRMACFVKRWMNESMQRAWNSVANSEHVVTETSVARLFSNLVAPFGDKHPYSCVPDIFFPNGERPPRNWPYIRQAAHQMFESWAREQSGPSSKRRKSKKSRPAAADADDMEEVVVNEEHVEDEAVSGEEFEEPAPEELGGSPDCTSQEDCVGHPQDRLVQHVIPNGTGDIYCESCWHSFVESNANLKGRYQDTGESA